MKHKILSFLTAFAMVFGIIAAPFVNASADNVAAPEGTDLKLSDTKPEETTVNVYKLQADEYNSPQQWEHNGGKLSNDQLNTLGKNVKPLKGVEFSYYEVTAAQLETLKATKPAPATAEAVKTALGTGFAGELKKLAKTDKKGMATVNLKNGNYWFIETETPADVKTDGAHAIPFALTLPQVQLVKNKDTGKFEAANPTKYLTELNIYPKNTTTKPQVDKDFKGKADATRDINTPKTEKRDYTLGDDVPYEIQTIIPAKTKYGSVYWTDQMTEGLTFKQDSLKVKFDDTDAVAADYNVTVDGNGFKLELTEAGLKKVEDKDKDVKITVTYEATLNKKSVVNIPESNDVIFHYGNKPGKGNTPKPNKPNKGKMEFTKSWVNEEGNTITPPDGAKVTVQLYNANTGEKVGETKELNATNKWKAEWTDLDDKIEYKVVEKSVEGYEAEYSKGEGLGVLGVKNWKSENPEPLNPHEPKVVHYGKRFVKADKGTNKSLEGAKFVIKFKSFTSEHLTAQTNKYLARKTADQTNADRAAYLEARARYEDKLADLEKDNQKSKEQKQQEANDFYKNNVKTAFDKLNTEYVWKESTVKAATGKEEFKNNDNLVVLESDKAGRFAIDGLPEGTYELVEVKAPKGYALPSNNFDFSVNAKSFNEQGDVKYEAENKEVTVSKGTTAKRIDNSNLSIPQTGGIGSIIFVVAGLTIMGLAAYKMKANKEQA
ncbi:LPXTG-motif protein cell wall anchor domain protein [Anaerococcus hydrogenalis]|nr:LPXTG-motif protein cell wall anchor domain protein [Anaerococcus hydrogenalis]